MNSASNTVRRLAGLLPPAVLLTSVLSASQVVVVDLVEIPPADESVWHVRDFTTSKAVRAGAKSYMASTYPSPTVYEFTTFQGLPTLSHQAVDSRDAALAVDQAQDVHYLTFDRDLKLRHRIRKAEWQIAHEYQRDNPPIGSNFAEAIPVYRESLLHRLQFIGVTSHFWAGFDPFITIFGGTTATETGSMFAIYDVDSGAEFINEKSYVRCVASDGYYHLVTKGSISSSEEIAPVSISGSYTSTIRILDPGSSTKTVIAFTSPRFPEYPLQDIFIFERSETGVWYAERIAVENSDYFLYGSYRHCSPLDFARGGSGCESLVFQDAATNPNPDGGTSTGQLRLAFRRSKSLPWKVSTILHQRAQTEFGSEITQFIPQSLLVSPEGGYIEMLGVAIVGCCPDRRYSSEARHLFIRAVNFEGLDWRATPATSLGAILEYVNPAEALPESWQSNTDSTIDIADYIGRHH